MEKEKRISVEYVDIDSVKPYANNAKMHPTEQIEQIKKSIQEFGFNDPIAVWNDTIVEGHGRLFAAKELGIEEIPIVRLDGLTDEQRRAYGLIHNQLTMNSGFDYELLQIELGEIDMDLTPFGLDMQLEDIELNDLDDESEKKQVVVSINCGDFSKYESIKDTLQEIADSIGGTIAVKMK